jgi:hypothetical protein
VTPGSTPARARDIVAFAFLYAQLAGIVWLVPRWSIALLREPLYLAVVATILTTAAITVLRLRGRRGSALERWILALFLAGMPVVYIWSWLRAPQPGWLGIELLGLVLFAGLAALGLFRSPWFLAGGIAAHGLGWDLWHYGRTEFIPDWYTIGCLIADIGLGVYAAVEALNE